MENSDCKTPTPLLQLLRHLVYHLADAKKDSDTRVFSFLLSLWGFGPGKLAVFLAYVDSGVEIILLEVLCWASLFSKKWRRGEEIALPNYGN